MKHFLILIFSIFIFSEIIAQSSSEMQNIDSMKFMDIMMQYENEVVIDVRLWRIYKKSRIDGALTAQDSEELKELVSQLDKEQPLLVYCNDGFRSETAAEMLTEWGFTQVYNLREGLDGWKDAGLPLDNERLWRWVY